MLHVLFSRRVQHVSQLIVLGKGAAGQHCQANSVPQGKQAFLQREPWSEDHDEHTESYQEYPHRAGAEVFLGL